jgi:hypothetical protein
MASNFDRLEERYNTWSTSNQAGFWRDTRRERPESSELVTPLSQKEIGIAIKEFHLNLSAQKPEFRDHVNYATSMVKPTLMSKI